MAGFMDSAAARLGAPAPGWVDELRREGRAAWKRQQMPTRKTEDWRYLNLRVLERDDYAAHPAPEVDPHAVDEASVAIEGLDACRLVFVNGRYAANLSTQDVPAGARLVRFADADEKQAARIGEHLGRLVEDKHLFAWLNTSWLEDGVFLEVEDDALIEKPFHIVWYTRDTHTACSVSQRLLVLAGTNSRFSLIEHFTSGADEQKVLTSGMTEIDLAEGARLDHYRLHLEESHALHIGGVHARLGASSTLQTFHLGLGSTLKRIDAVVYHTGEGAHCEMNGIYLPRGQEQIDYHTTIEHAHPGCTTDETFRGIVADRARAVFNGRIHIHPDAHRTRAELSNKNLLTSPHAEVDTKPELEIYADDVQCAHGATVAQLEEAPMYYLQSRGIAREEAEVMLSFGFINELVGRVSLTPLADFLRATLAARFAGAADASLTRHIAPAEDRS